jgi:GNAT superfamily N-acetyltransferase
MAANQKGALIVKFTINNINYEIRKWQNTDSISELTELLHRSYRPLADMGLIFLATHQTDTQTKRRIEKGDCFVIENEGKLIATVSIYPNNKSNECLQYRKEGTAYFGQFAVESHLQKNGIGSRLMEFIEQYARDKGYTELALDTSEKALHLIEYYKKRGYRFVHFHQWDIVNYRSVVMSKSLI